MEIDTFYYFFWVFWDCQWG